MKFIRNQSTDPQFNLALEEYLLQQTQLDTIMLWRNSKAVIIGNNQNTIEELDVNYVKEHGITVVRRQSGGGAVFHDLGNINFTVIHALKEDDFSNYAKFTAPICDFLRGLGVNARLEGRNDLTIDGLKFSGNAQAVKNDRIMHHGTILYNADFSDLAASLKPRDIKIASKAVSSVRARVTNVASHMENPMRVEDFFDKLAAYFLKHVGGISEYELTAADIAATEKLVAEKYSTWEWNFGKSPAYTYENSVKFPFGLVEIKLQASSGVIERAHIFGDFFGELDKSELEERLAGVRHDRCEIARALDGIAVERYIHGITTGELTELF